MDEQIYSLGAQRSDAMAPTLGSLRSKRTQRLIQSIAPAFYPSLASEQCSSGISQPGLPTAADGGSYGTTVRRT